MIDASGQSGLIGNYDTTVKRNMKQEKIDFDNESERLSFFSDFSCQDL